MDTKSGDPVLKYCAVGRQLGYGMYLSLDMFTYVSAGRWDPWLEMARRWANGTYKA